MASFIFDGSASVTAAKADNVFITANPALFTSETQSGGNVVLTYSNGTTLTVTGTTLGDSATSLPGVSLAGGTFATGATVPNTTSTTPSQLYFLGAGTAATADADSTVFTASSVHTIFGGTGVSDPNDGSDTITIGGKGSFLVYGNAGADTITQGANIFDSTSFVTAFGGKNALGNDSITLNNVGNLNAKFALYGGEGTDSITVYNNGTTANTAIFGGQGAADSTDLADSINFDGGGTASIFGNAGNDVIVVGGAVSGTAGLATGSTLTVHGGIGADNTTVTGATLAVATGGAKSTITVFGDENAAGIGAGTANTNADSITVTQNAGTTVIYGGTAAADSNDNADIISYSGQGTATIYAAGGDDSVTINTVLNSTTATNITNASSTTTVFLGNGNDSINILNTSTATGTQTITGGAGIDTFVLGTSSAAATPANAATGAGTGITITDFTVGTDILQINNSTAGATTGKAAFIAPAGSSLQQALDAASQNVVNGTVGVVTFQGDTYVVVNQTADAANNPTVAVAGFSATTDVAIKLTGVTDAAGVTAAIVIV